VDEAVLIRYAQLVDAGIGHGDDEPWNTSNPLMGITQVPRRRGVVVDLEILLRRRPLAGAYSASGVDRSHVRRPASLVARLVVICIVILIAALRIVRIATWLRTAWASGRHAALDADHHRPRGGDVGFVMSTGEPKITRARDTMFAVVMLVLNGFMCLALAASADCANREQAFNLQSATRSSRLIVRSPSWAWSCRTTRARRRDRCSRIPDGVPLGDVIGIYSVSWGPERRHRGSSWRRTRRPTSSRRRPAQQSARSTLFHASVLGALRPPLVVLAKQMAQPLDALVGRIGARRAGGIRDGAAGATPESIAAIARAANACQRSVNILLGSVLASIGLTIPLVIRSRSPPAAADARPRRGRHGHAAPDVITSILTFSLPRTNLLLGCVHLLLFGAYLMLMFDR